MRTTVNSRNLELTDELATPRSTASCTAWSGSRTPMRMPPWS